jgi:hypothetical protein
MNDETKKLEAVRRLRDALRLAGEGMRDVIATAEFLRAWPLDATEDDDLVRVRATLETGMFVTYARPFTASGLNRLNSASGLSRDLCDLHDDIIGLRHRVYAHTDETPWREIVGGDSPLSDFGVSSLYPTAKLLEEVIVLARAQLAGFLASLEDLNRHLIGEEGES